MPSVDSLTPLGTTFRSWLPVVLRDSPDHLAVLHVLAREMERLEAAIETVRAQFNPLSADVLLKAWEAQLRTTVEPVGQTVVQRRETVLALLARMRSTPSGLDWQANVTALVGPGWTYEEHDPNIPGSPPAYTLRLTLPYPPSSSLYAQAEALVRELTPSHLDLELVFSGGFVLDQSQLDQEGVQ